MRSVHPTIVPMTAKVQRSITQILPDLVVMIVYTTLIGADKGSRGHVGTIQ